jgi:hypothetical protein
MKPASATLLTVKSEWTMPMLAEKFILLLETLRSQAQAADGSPRVVSSSPHVPVKLPSNSTKPR